jgi:toxin ParE1/3/4
MTFAVRFTKEALRDLRSIAEYISISDSPARADSVVRGIVRAALKLEDMPQRGSHPAELLQQGRTTYRQISYKPCRIFYRVRGDTVNVGLIADGRRDVSSLLTRRLLKP